jgi:hypothetical protein
MQFLQQQAQLLEMIRAAGLNAGDILGGLQLGINADMDQVINAMTRAMELMIQKANQALGIASPSKEFEYMGAMMSQGLIKGFTGGSRLDARMPVLPPAGSVVRSISHSISAPITMHINNGMDQAVAESWIRRLVSSEVG